MRGPVATSQEVVTGVCYGPAEWAMMGPVVTSQEVVTGVVL